MDTSYFEIYIQPDSGPCTVQERSFSGEASWTEESVAVAVAEHKKKVYPNLDFLVHKVTGHEREVVYRTKK